MPAPRRRRGVPAEASPWHPSREEPWRSCRARAFGALTRGRREERRSGPGCSGSCPRWCRDAMRIVDDADRGRSDRQRMDRARSVARRCHGGSGGPVRPMPPARRAGDAGCRPGSTSMSWFRASEKRRSGASPVHGCVVRLVGHIHAAGNRREDRTPKGNVHHETFDRCREPGATVAGRRRAVMADVGTGRMTRHIAARCVAADEGSWRAASASIVTADRRSRRGESRACESRSRHRLDDPSNGPRGACARALREWSSWEHHYRLLQIL